MADQIEEESTDCPLDLSIIRSRPTFTNRFWKAEDKAKTQRTEVAMGSEDIFTRVCFFYLGLNSIHGNVSIWMTRL